MASNSRLGCSQDHAMSPHRPGCSRRTGARACQRSSSACAQSRPGRAQRRQVPDTDRCDRSTANPRSVRRAATSTAASSAPISQVCRQWVQWRWPWSTAGRTWYSSRPSTPCACCTTPRSSSTSSVRYTVDGIVEGSTCRQRSTSSAPVTWPSLWDSTSTRTRRWGVQRRPRSWRRWRTPAHGPRSDRNVATPEEPCAAMTRSMGVTLGLMQCLATTTSRVYDVPSTRRPRSA